MCATKHFEKGSTNTTLSSDTSP